MDITIYTPNSTTIDFESLPNFLLNYDTVFNSLTSISLCEK